VLALRHGNPAGHRIKEIDMLEVITPESKLVPLDYAYDVTEQRERYAEILLDDEDSWDDLMDMVMSQDELTNDLDACIKNLVEKRRHTPANSSSVQAAVMGVVYVFERAAMEIAKVAIK
jgi:K+/H+ antiporter YhaU regulatory subunit KhtT